tara:strand:- start:390 stop:638 length:249 start_codon:yes stop_codon:yes gene_type:complete
VEYKIPDGCSSPSLRGKFRYPNAIAVSTGMRFPTALPNVETAILYFDNLDFFNSTWYGAFHDNRLTGTSLAATQDKQNKKVK